MGPANNDSKKGSETPSHLASSYEPPNYQPPTQADLSRLQAMPGPPPTPNNHDGLKSLVSTLLLFLLAPIIALTITAFLFQSYEVDGQSMETTLSNHDRLIVSKIPRTLAKVTGHSYIPNRGDIIIFDKGGLIDNGGNEERQLIKRVVALPGERVVVRDNKLIVFNKEHPEGFEPDKTGDYTINLPTTGAADRVLGPNEIFVCGDNRTNSMDSRYFGPIEANAIVGKLVLRVLPIKEAQGF